MKKVLFGIAMFSTFLIAQERQNKDLKIKWEEDFLSKRYSKSLINALESSSSQVCMQALKFLLKKKVVLGPSYSQFSREIIHYIGPLLVRNERNIRYAAKNVLQLTIDSVEISLFVESSGKVRYKKLVQMPYVIGALEWSYKHQDVKYLMQLLRLIKHTQLLMVRDFRVIPSIEHMFFYQFTSEQLEYKNRLPSLLASILMDCDEQGFHSLYSLFNKVHLMYDDGIFRSHVYSVILYSLSDANNKELGAHFIILLLNNWPIDSIELALKQEKYENHKTIKKSTIRYLAKTRTSIAKEYLTYLAKKKTEFSDIAVKELEKMNKASKQ